LNEDNNKESLLATCYVIRPLIIFSSMMHLINKDHCCSTNCGINCILTGIIIWSLTFIIPDNNENKSFIATLFTLLLLSYQQPLRFGLWGA